MKNGFLYESTVLQAIKTAGISGKIDKPAECSSVGHDADFSHKGKIYNVEVKLDRNAQMGGSSVRYVRGSQKIELLEAVDDSLENLLIEAVRGKECELDQLIGFVAENWNKDIAQFPFTCSKEVWTQAQQNKLLVNTKIAHDVGFIVEHYAKKNVHYIQIGKSGLFYLGENPADLPVPKLEGNIAIEIRSGRSGSKKRKDGIKVVGSGLRIQARLRTRNVSPYTLDNTESIRDMIQWADFYSMF